MFVLYCFIRTIETATTTIRVGERILHETKRSKVECGRTSVGKVGRYRGHFETGRCSHLREIAVRCKGDDISVSEIDRGVLAHALAIDEAPIRGSVE
eukprot:6173705-Pleurochrysis_carterae.AAC.2